MSSQENKDLAKLLRAALQLITRGLVEGAYDRIVVGPKYAERVVYELERRADILSGKEPRARKNPSHGEQENIYESLVAEGVPIDHYESTLYAKVTPVSKAIVAAANHSLRKTITTFVDNIDKKMWYDIPFAYSPFWEKKKR